MSTPDTSADYSRDQIGKLRDLDLVLNGRQVRVVQVFPNTLFVSFIETPPPAYSKTIEVLKAKFDPNFL